MEKTILVTVEEFLKNGGILKAERQLYTRGKMPDGWFVEMVNEHTLLRAYTGSKMQCDVALIYLEVPVIPQYI